MSSTVCSSSQEKLEAQDNLKLADDCPACGLKLAYHRSDPAQPPAGEAFAPADGGVRTVLEAMLTSLNILVANSSPPVSFGMTPPVGEEYQRGSMHPQAPRGGRRRHVDKAQRYAWEFESKVRLHTTRYKVRFYTSRAEARKVFEVVQMEDVQQDESAVAFAFRCEGSHGYIKSAFFAFGMQNDDIEKFLQYVSENPIEPYCNLSPESSPGVTEYAAQPESLESV